MKISPTAHRDRAALIQYVETEGTVFERIWLPLLRLSDRYAHWRWPNNG